MRCQGSVEHAADPILALVPVHGSTVAGLN
jgi:hypothetical protein